MTITPTTVARTRDAEQQILQLICERDNYHEWADRLADAIAQHFDADIGEHSNINNPWCAALDAFQIDGHPDSVAVDRFAAAMKAKLAAKRAQGRGGWNDKTQCSQGYLSLLLRAHVAKGDPVDVANFAMMLHQRGERISGRDEATPFDLLDHLRRQAEFSARTFGPGERVAAIIDHLTKELEEVRQSGGALAEWIDVIILGFDGAWRSGATPEEIVQALLAKQSTNEARTWPDWRTAPPDRAIEHVRGAEAPTPEQVRGAEAPTPEQVRGAEAPTPEQVYLSGPMSGIAEHNFPAFHAAAGRLRALGYGVVNPAEINTDPAATWHQCLRNDMAALAHCDTLALLPGWERSDGAHLELHVAHRLKMRIVRVEELASGAGDAA